MKPGIEKLELELGFGILEHVICKLGIGSWNWKLGIGIGTLELGNGNLEVGLGNWELKMKQKTDNGK